ncbi:mechanosensitive ion channel family protein [Microvirga puerhi]|uniref:Mechanosensitive ion channel family protein n=1 Tax=Microvirga puerhi TaxID=2876078 RepID=A0ABS7VTS6_9HYPH|nr:mechanosensitive ion channel family protein [Microvirga puerhi]MBZ6078973.1 mechanosensitive ion channel family protein [Microvirga puerhi]
MRDGMPKGPMAMTNAPDTASIFDWLNDLTAAVETGGRERLHAMGDIGTDWNAVKGTIAAAGSSPGIVLAIAVGALLASILIWFALSRSLDRVPWLCRTRILRVLAVGFLSILVIAGVARLAPLDESGRVILRTLGAATILSLLVRQLLRRLMIDDAQAAASIQGMLAFADTVAMGMAWGLFGIAVLAILRSYGAGPGLHDVVGTFAVTLPATLLLASAYWRRRSAIMVAVAGPQPWSPTRQRFAKAWPVIAIVALLGTAVVLQLGVTLGHPLPGLPMLLTLLLVLVAPHVDSAIGVWAERRERTSSSSVMSASLRRTARFAFAILVLVLLGYEWALPALEALGSDVQWIRAKAIAIALVALIGSLLWNATGVAIARIARQDSVGPSDEEVQAPRSRLGTLLPLLGSTAKIGILVFTILTILVVLDVNVWPVITGLSVFGLAIGFGSQTLVKDIVSGLFFLVDDAFRLGEYIETSGAKGTVEKISVRSVSLRHPRGAIATIPYGQIGKIQNYSRDWVIEKLVFRVAFDTDVEKVRKLFKQIGQEIANDPNLNVDLLEPFKSQGIASVEDGTLLVRGKFKARAGKQFGIRKAVLTAVQRAFQENDIMAVPRPMPVPALQPGT